MSRWRRRNRDRDLDEELRDHVERQTEQNIRRGMTPEQARRQALLQFGNVPLVKEDTRAVWTRVGVEQLLQDLRFGARILTRSPGLSATAAILIALVIGINTTIFSMVNGMVRRPAPGVTADDLVKIALADRPGAGFFSVPDYLEYQKQTKTLRALTAFTNRRVNMTLDRGTYPAFLTAVDANYFETVGVSVALGRGFTRADGELSGTTGLTAVISDQTWKNHFWGASDVVGRRIDVNGIPATIIGVAPPLFRGTMAAERADLWLPLLAFWRVLMPEAAQRFVVDRAAGSVDLIGRLAPGRRVSEAQAEFSTIETRIRRADPATERHPVSVVRYAATAGGVVPAIMPAFLALFSIVTLLTVLIVSANVANLMLARSLARQRETAVRQSLGASRGRVVRLLFAEGLSIALVAWLSACLMTVWAARIIPNLLPPTPLGESGLNFTPDWRVVSYAMLLAAVGAIAFTVAPALRVWKQDPLPWLKAGEQSVARGRSRVSSALVVMQLAFSVVLLTGAGLASRSASMMTVDLGFETKDMLVVRVSTAASARTRDAHLSIVDQIRERLTRIPGAQSVSYFEFPNRRSVRAVGSAQPTLASVYTVGDDYFKVLGLRVRTGRALEPDDRWRTTAVAVINQNMADALWPGEAGVGQMMLVGPDGRSAEVVGVVANAFVAGFNPERPEPKPNYVFVPEQRSSGETGQASGPGPGEVTFYMRHDDDDLERVAGAVGPAVREIDRRISIVFLRTMREQLELLALSASMIARLLVIFSMVSLVIAAIGQYAVVAFSMRRRVREFGLRIALGASTGQVLGGVLREGLFLTCVGLLCGLALSIAVAVAARSVLFNVTPTDPQTYAGVFAILAIVSLVACCLPARGASRVDPVQALRQE
ncbi:MAG TPA: ADOP family duplicated permease [Vicinamibacterales bacterium]|nr:ADOP family duplicated permease [Vicinamibacterales bacterium]